MSGGTKPFKQHSVLSAINRLHDPLGFIAPVTCPFSGSSAPVKATEMLHCSRDRGVICSVKRLAVWIGPFYLSLSPPEHTHFHLKKRGTVCLFWCALALKAVTTLSTVVQTHPRSCLLKWFPAGNVWPRSNPRADQPMVQVEKESKKEKKRTQFAYLEKLIRQ